MWQKRQIEKPILTGNQIQDPWFESGSVLPLSYNHYTTTHSQSYIHSSQVILNVSVSIYTQIESKIYLSCVMIV